MHTLGPTHRLAVPRMHSSPRVCTLVLFILCRFTLTLDNGQEVERTVERYFADTYNIKLRYPNLPCLHVAAKNKNVYLPLEVRI